MSLPARPAIFLKKLFRPLGVLVSFVARVLSRVKPIGFIGARRPMAAHVWRKLVRGVIVLVGLSVFLGIHYFIGYSVFEEWWKLPAGLFIAAITFAAVVWRPSVAFVAWLAVSPLGTIFLQIDFGANLPAVTFDRLALYSLAALFALRTMVYRIPARRMTMPELLLSGYVLFSGVNMFFHEPAVQIRDLNVFVGIVLLSAVLYFVAKAAITTKEQIVWILIALAVVGVYSALSGIYEHETGNMWFSSFIGESYKLMWSDVGTGRSAGPFGNTTVYGAMLGLTTFAAFHLSIYTDKRWAKALCYASMALMVVGCYFCFTRGGYIPLALFLLFMPFLAVGARKQYALATLVSVVILIAAVPVMLGNRLVYERMSRESTVIGRIATSATQMNVFRHNMVFGVGLNRVHYVMERYVTNAGSVSGMWARGGGYDSPLGKLRPVVDSHNSVLTILDENGLIGGLLYYGAILWFVVRVFAIRSRLKSHGMLGKDYASLIITFIAGNLLSSTVYDVRYFAYPNYVFWILIATVVRLDELSAAEAQGPSKAGDQTQDDGALAHA